MLLAVNAQAHVLGQVLAYKTVHALVRASLAEAIQIAKIHSNYRVLAELFVPRHFPAEWAGQCSALLSRNVLQDMDTEHVRCRSHDLQEYSVNLTDDVAR